MTFQQITNIHSKINTVIVIQYKSYAICQWHFVMAANHMSWPHLQLINIHIFTSLLSKLTCHSITIAVLSGVAGKIPRGGKIFQGQAKISKSKIFPPKKLFHEFHGTCHSVTFIVMVNSHQRWKQTRNRVCFHLWCELTLA